MHSVQYVSPDALKPNPRNARTHSKKQIRQIADSIVAYGFTVPVMIDENSMLLAGHGRLEAAKLRGLKRIPAITLRGLSEAQKRALLIADNKIAENTGWNRERLAIELPELAELLIEESLDIYDTLGQFIGEIGLEVACALWPAAWITGLPRLKVGVSRRLAVTSRETSGSSDRIACYVEMHARLRT